MADVTSAEPVVRFGDVAIVGGGCYGTFYAGQLLRARERGRAEFRELLVVDRDAACRFAGEIGDGDGRRLVVSDWDTFFDEFLARPERPGEPPDTIVPSPLMPHLMFQWILRRARSRWPGRAVNVRPADTPVGTPYDTLAPDGTRYVSYADWICPVHCIEPAICPMIRAPRTWEMSEALERTVARRAAQGRSTAGPVVFHCRHRVYGVGMFDAAEVRAGDGRVIEAARAGPIDILVGTVSSCHGAVSLMEIGPEP